MMGHQTDSQDKLFYSFNLEDHVGRARMRKHATAARRALTQMCRHD